MIAGRRLFLGETDYQTVKLVQQAEVPSLSRINPEVDPAFESVIGQCLSRDPNVRFQSAREMGDALAGYLFSHKMKVTSYDIATLVSQVVADKRNLTKTSSPKDQSIIDRLIQEELLRFTSLDDMADPLSPGAQPLSPEDVDGGKPLDIGAFENPAEWFAEDADVAAGVQSASQAQPGTGGPAARPHWLESGQQDLAGMLEADEVRRDPTGQRRPPQAGAQQQQPRAPQAAPRMPQSASAAPPKSGGGAVLYVFIGLVLLAGAGAAAAWFGGFIPH
jgi:serine/threonine-protein kinase